MILDEFDEQLKDIGIQRQRLDQQEQEIIAKREFQKAFPEQFKEYLAACARFAAEQALESSDTIISRKSTDLTIVPTLDMTCPFKGTSNRQQVMRITFDHIIKTRSRLLKKEIIALVKAEAPHIPEDFLEEHLSRMLSGKKEVFCSHKLGWGLVSVHGRSKE